MISLDGKYKDFKLFHKRSWLNPSSSVDTGHIKSYATLEEWTETKKTGEKKKPTYDIDASFTLADCCRKVDINLSCSTKRQAAQRVRKIDVIIQHLLSIQLVIVDNMEKLK